MNTEIRPIPNEPPHAKVKIFFTLVQLRKSNNMTQAELAEVLEIDQSMVSHIETGRRMANPELLRKIADHFEVSVEELHIDNPTVEMALQLIGEDVYSLYHHGAGLLSKEDRQHLLQVVRTLKPQVLAEETVVTKFDKDGKQVRESVHQKLKALGIET